MMPLAAGLIALSCLVAAGLLAAHLVAAHIRVADLRRLKDLLAVHAEKVPQPRAGIANRLPSFLERKLARAGWEPSRRQLTAGAAILSLAILAATAIAGLLAGLLSAVTLASLVLVALEYRAGVRVRLLSDCMLGFLERMRQLLSVGNSLSVALERAVENSPPIVTECLTPTLRRIAHGVERANALVGARTASLPRDAATVASTSVGSTAMTTARGA